MYAIKDNEQDKGKVPKGFWVGVVVVGLVISGALSSSCDGNQRQQISEGQMINLGWRCIMGCRF